MKFLQQVAKYYTDKSDSDFSLGDYIMVLPNRRSALFLNKYFKEYAKSTTFLPRFITVTAFTQSFCTQNLAEPTELLFILFQSYRQVCERHPNHTPMEFDAFVNLGTTLLNDFNEIDAYLADTNQLFKNIRLEREIQSNFLTPAQQEVANLLGLNIYLSEEKPDFWKHVPNSPSNNQAAEKFLHLWEILGDIYTEFKKRLQELNLSYSGQQSAEALSVVKEMSLEDFHGKRFAFVGFNVLSTARLMIFKRMQELGIGEFFWDTAYTQCTIPGNQSSTEILALAKALPANDDFVLEAITSLPEINIYPIASNVGQAKIASHLIQQMQNPSSVEVGVILPDDNLLVPLLYSLPPTVEHLNVTMKVPLTNTPFASMMNTIIMMQERARTIRGDYYYYFKDVFEILSQPYITLLAKEETETIRKKINDAHLFNVKATDILAWIEELREKRIQNGEKAGDTNPCCLCAIFEPVDNVKDISHIKKYLDNLIATLYNQLSELLAKKGSEASERVTTYELRVLDAYRKHIEKVFELAHRHEITMSKLTFFSLLKRLLATEFLPLTGRPVEGMQIMGIEDARAIDFETLTILSLNERIFPRNSYTASVIPPTLRLGYGLPTPEHEEMSVSYHFYRLISRAKVLNLIYDSRTPDLSTGEVSRYITQLEMLLPKRSFNVHNLKLGLSVGEKRALRIDKDDQVMAQLREYCKGGDRYFSASTLKTFISCPLRFYFEKVRHLSIENFDPEYMDAASYGTIMHRLAQDYYERQKKGLPEGTFINEATQKRAYSDPHVKEYLVNRAKEIMNTEYYGEKFSPNTPNSFFPGEGRVLAQLMASYMIKMLEEESKLGDYEYLHGEFDLGKKIHQWKINDDLTINFNLSIDRVDRIIIQGSNKEVLRIIDYKTGKEESSAGTMEQLMTGHKQQAVFQLFTYCLAYNDLYSDKYAFQPRIYSFPKLGDKGLPSITVNGNKITTLDDEYDSGHTILEAFREEFHALIERIFDPEVPFCQTEDEDNCTYCPFVNLCGRQSNKRDD